MLGVGRRDREGGPAHGHAPQPALLVRRQPDRRERRDPKERIAPPHHHCLDCLSAVWKGGAVWKCDTSARDDVKQKR